MLDAWIPGTRDVEYGLGLCDARGIHFNRGPTNQLSSWHHSSLVSHMTCDLFNLISKVKAVKFQQPTPRVVLQCEILSQDVGCVTLNLYKSICRKINLTQFFHELLFFACQHPSKTNRADRSHLPQPPQENTASTSNVSFQTVTPEEVEFDGTLTLRITGGGCCTADEGIHVTVTWRQGGTIFPGRRRDGQSEVGTKKRNFRSLGWVP